MYRVDELMAALVAAADGAGYSTEVHDARRGLWVCQTPNDVNDLLTEMFEDKEYQYDLVCEEGNFRREGGSVIEHYVVAYPGGLIHLRLFKHSDTDAHLCLQEVDDAEAMPAALAAMRHEILASVHGASAKDLSALCPWIVVEHIAREAIALEIAEVDGVPLTTLFAALKERLEAAGQARAQEEMASAYRAPIAAMQAFVQEARAKAEAVDEALARL